MVRQSLHGATRLIGINALLRRSRRDGVLVLAYHGVVSRGHADDRQAYRNTVSVDEFDDQLRTINRFFNPVAASDLIEALDGATSLPERAVLVTFDDGYRNNLTHAAPLLERHGIPALINVSTGYVGSSRGLWTDDITDRVTRWPSPLLPMPGGEPARAVGVDVAARLRLAGEVRERCKQIPDDERCRYVDRLRELPLADDRNGDEERLAFLDWDGVRALSRRGFAIGSHTVDHPILSRLAPEALAYQLRTSRAAIEREIGVECRCLAYPNGQPADVTPAVEAAAAAAGYRLGLTTGNRFNRAGALHRFAIGRVVIPGHLPTGVFHARVSGVHELLQRASSSGLWSAQVFGGRAFRPARRG